jgi:hypothetical protein
MLPPPQREEPSMAERTIVVCDVCGKPATETVTIKVARGNFAKDLCATHVTELVAGARRPRPGRPRKMAGSAQAAAPKRRGRPRKTAGRPRKAAATGKKATRARRKAQSSASSARTAKK